MPSDNEKVKHIAEMAASSHVVELHGYLGMVTYLVKFMPHVCPVSIEEFDRT